MLLSITLAYSEKMRQLSDENVKKQHNVSYNLVFCTVLCGAFWKQKCSSSTEFTLVGLGTASSMRSLFVGDFDQAYWCFSGLVWWYGIFINKSNYSGIMLTECLHSRNCKKGKQTREWAEKNLRGKDERKKYRKWNQSIRTFQLTLKV